MIKGRHGVGTLLLILGVISAPTLANQDFENEITDRESAEQFLEELEPTTQWLGSLGQHLATGVDDPWVNVFATTVQLPDFSLTVGQRDAIWKAARKAGWDDPTVLWQLWAAKCPPYNVIEGRTTESSCGDPEVEARLRALEPDNAAALVLGIDNTGTDADDLLSPENRRLLDAAGQLQTFTTWSLAGADRLYRAIAEFVASNPPPDGFSADPFGATAFELFVLTLVSDSGSTILGTSRFVRPCRTAFQLDEASILNACRSIIEAIKATARSEITLALATELGFGFDVSHGADGKPSGWAEESRRQSDLRSCRSTAFLEHALDAVTEENQAEQLANEVATRGPRRAWHNAAIHDFAQHPERYTVDPSDCEAAFPVLQPAPR
ncbi:MAG: hypothetical protein V2I57_02695 [Xanthomonadales bacterium]|nr:hypothetical protein [Xanthomonadales bacterium]